jgi:HTH-type transcriptional regulator, bacterioopsin transcriptional activator and related proteins
MSRQPLTESLQETLGLFEKFEVPLTTNEVADHLDLGRRSTYDRLDRLVDHGRLETKKVGASARVWWRPSPSVPDWSERFTDWPAAAESLIGDVLDGADVGVFVLDEDFTVAWINKATERYFGLDREQVLGRDKRTLVEEHIASVVDDSASVAETVLATYDDNSYIEQFECHVTAGDSREERWLEHRSKPIKSGVFAGGRVELYYDVTNRKRTEQAQKENREQFESLIAAVEEYAIFLLDTEGRIQTWNPGAEQIKGYEADDILGEHFSIFYTDDAREANIPEKNLAAATENGSIEETGLRVREDGSRFWASVTITAIWDDDGELEGYAKVTRDATERRAYEQQLREEKAFTESLFNNQQDIFYAFDTEGTFLRWNDRGREVTGYTDAETQAMHPLEFIDDDGVADAAAAIEQAIEQRESVTAELPLKTKDGAVIPYEFTAAPLIDDDEEVVGLTGIGRDITDRKRQQRLLERQRDNLQLELQEVFDRVDDAFFALDEEWRFSHVNDQAATFLNRSVGELIGQDVWEAFPNAVGSTFQKQYEHAFETQESISFEAPSSIRDGWLEVTVYPSESGLSVYFQDITDRKGRERELERYETIVETVGDGIYVVDQHGYFTDVNTTYASMVGYPREDLIGAHVSKVIDDEDVLHEAQRLEDELAAGERTTVSLEAEFTTPDGDSWVGEATFALLQSDDGYERVGVVRDITDRTKREQELTQYETIVETIDDGIYAVDDDAQFILVNEGFCELTGYDREELLDAHATTIHDDEITPQAESMAGEIVAGERDTARIELDINTKSGDNLPCESRLAPLPLGDSYGRCGMVRDISDRLEREQKLQRRIYQQQVVTELGQRALEDHDIDALLADASELVADTLDNKCCKVLDLDTETAELRVRQGVGWHDGIVGSATVSADEDDSQAAYTLRTEQPVVVTDLDTESRFSGSELLTSHDIRSGISTIIGSRDDLWGILGTHDTTCKEFSEHDVNFVQSVATILATAIARHDHEQELIRQREQLGALNHLNDVVREIIDAIIEQSTREEMEATVCELLADSESYLFAWIGDVDVASQTIHLRTEAGVEGYLDENTISVDPDDERSKGPTGRAFQTGTTQTIQDIDTDTRYDPWRDSVAKHGFRSSAAIPIVFEDTIYGVLNVYAERPDAFVGQERVVIDQLGEVIGHAIAATERRQALMSNEVVELEFQTPNVFDALEISPETSGTITFDHAVPSKDSEYLVYGSVTVDAIDSVKALVETVPHWREVIFRNEAADTQFELRLSEPPVLSAVASVGGSVEKAIIDHGDFHMTVYVSPSVDVRRIISVVEESYPAARLLKRRQITRDNEPSEDIQRGLTTELTERQRTTLMAAYYAGFFEWPREVTGEELADSLGIAAPTFHQHLRKAERKTFDHLLSNYLNPRWQEQE